MKNKKKLYFLLLLLIPLNAIAQKPFIVCEKCVYDMGKIEESKGKVEHTFVIKNIGKGVLVIQKCKASCGCTSPTWTKQPIASGKIGKVKILFDPKGQIGTFVKYIYVYSNATQKPMILTFRGEVKS